MLEVKLLVRTRRSVRLTDAGRILLEEAPRAVGAVARASARAQLAGRGETGELAIGFLPSATAALIPAVIREYRALYPDVHLELQEMLDDPLLEAVESSRVDVGILRATRRHDEGIRIEPVLRDQTCAVLPEDHPLATRRRLAYRDLAGERFVLWPRHQAREGYYMVIERCRAAGFSPEIVQESTLPYTTLGLVAAGLGISVLSGSLRALRAADVVFVPLTGEPGTLSLAWRPAQVSAVRDNFLDTVRCTARGISETPRFASGGSQP